VSTIQNTATPMAKTTVLLSQTSIVNAFNKVRRAIGKRK
jgi:hypothetical protein